MSASTGMIKRAWVVYLMLMLFGGAILVRLFWLQLGEGDHWRAQSKEVAMSVRTVQPDRGHVFSDDGRLLATSVPRYEVRLDLRADGLTEERFKGNLDSLARGLAALFADRSHAEYKALLQNARTNNDRYMLLKRRVDHNQLQVLEKLPLFREGRNKSGLIVVRSMERMHPFGRLAARTVGYVVDSVGVGIEGGYGPWLHGVTGKRMERRLTGGVWMPVEDGTGVDPVPGYDVHSTIDINLQDVTDAALEEQLRKYGAHHGTVVVMETATGYVKAISNLTMGADSVYRETLNYAVGAATEPGSTFKIAALMVGLEDKLLDVDQVFDTRGGKHRFYDRTMKDSHEGGYGVVSLHRALEVSSNTAISRAVNDAYANKPERFVEGLRRLGFGAPLGMRIPGEGMPVLRGPEDRRSWSGVSLPWMSIGYELSATPMGMLAFYNAIANDGRLMQPQFASHVSRNGKTVERFEPVTLNAAICSASNLQKVRRILEGVVDSGTATNLRAAHFRIAGKTGTAQIASEKAGYKVNGVSYQASFVGYFPAEAPKYSCIVVISSPSQRGYYGNVVAGPIFREIADKIYSNRLDMQTSEGSGIAHAAAEQRTPVTLSGHAADLRAAMTALGVPHSGGDDAEWVVTQALDSVVALGRRSVPEHGDRLVPNVVGMGLRDALALLENQGLRVQVQGRGMVRKQSLSAGTRFTQGSTIHIQLGV